MAIIAASSEPDLFKAGRGGFWFCEMWISEVNLFKLLEVAEVTTGGMMISSGGVRMYSSLATSSKAKSSFAVMNGWGGMGEG